MITVRTATSKDVAQLAKIHVDTLRISHRGLIPDSVLDSLTYHQREQVFLAILASGDTQCLAAQSGKELVGFASCGTRKHGPEHYQAEIYMIYVLPEHQMKDVGKKLMGAVGDHLRQNGFTSALLWALSSSASRGFFEALGGQIVAEENRHIGSRDLHLVAYG